FLNGVTLSPTFPPLDPWLSGYGISYYYFGYVMTSLLARLAVVPTAVAFNLAIAWLVAGAAVGAFGVVYNLVAGGGIRNYELGIRDSEERRVAPGSSYAPAIKRRAITLGIIAALAVPVAGNMQIGLEVLHGNGVGSDSFWQWLNVRDINGPADSDGVPRYQTSEWWWWRTSRVIHEYTLAGRAEEGLEPIVEVPAFSYVLGDLHPHVLALPFAFLSLGVALAWWLRLTIRNDELGIRNEKEGRPGWLRGTIRNEEGIGPGWPLWLLTALVLGGLSFLNTWDVGIHLFVVLGAFFLAGWRRQGHTSGLWRQTALMAVLLVAAAFVFYLPFYLGFRSQAGPPFLLPMLMRPTRLAHYAIIFGLPLVAITVLLVTLAARQRFRHWQTGLGAVAAVVGGLFLVMLLLLWVVAASQSSSGTISNLAGELGLSLPARPEGAVALGWGLRAAVAVLPAWLAARAVSPGLLLLLSGLLALVVMALRSAVEEASPLAPRQRVEERGNLAPSSLAPWERVRERGHLAWAEHATLPFALLLILTGVLLTLGPEFVYLRDNFGVRLNTTFKFYYQAWAMFGVAAVFALDYLLATRQQGSQRLVIVGTTAVYVALLAVALLFPFYAVQSRAAEYRGPARDSAGARLERQPATLDGLAALQRANPSEYEALAWLRNNAVVPGEAPPVVLEAVGGQYSAFGRVAANTGLPTVLGWAGHEWQWRGSDHPEPGRRGPLVEQIYTTPDLNAVAFLLDELNVRYIYVGDLETSTYGGVGLEKFRDRLEVAFANDRVTIYRWQPGSPN
ncbi:MAG TPA: DUF2298 domain-containing protein, partial [Promineifilum sp.]|nr:DUF2298 domain-containing protein [Promineifilum sp.]